MDGNRLFAAVVWVAFVIYVWRVARGIENARLQGQRPPHDTLRLIGFAALFAFGFSIVLFLVSGAALMGQSMVAGVDIRAIGVVALTTYLMFALGLAVARRRERVSFSRSLVESAKLMGAAIGYIAAMLCVFLTMNHFVVASEDRAWGATFAIVVGTLAAWVAIRLRLRRRSVRPVKQGHAE